jgi:Zn-dependent metalloprotease
MSSSHCDLCHIIPSSMLRKLALHQGMPDQQRDALLVSAEAAAFARGERTVARIAGFASLSPPSTQKHRDVFDSAGKKTIPGKLLRTEGGPAVANDPAVNEAYDSTGTTYDFYKEILNRNSVDGRGLKLESTVHSGRAPDNAFWNGSRMVFGDATAGGPFTGSFTATVDVVAHELTHGVTQYTVPGGLDYVDQSGALNESWSDVFGSIVKQWAKKQDVKTADWLIGGGLMKAEFGTALRSMKDPGKAWSGDDQPRDMSGYVEGGDVHTNSGIPNHAFFLAATGIGGYSWDKAGRIWYRALSLLTSQATFADAGKATIDAAAALFGATGPETAAVTKAWKAVKVL